MENNQQPELEKTTPKLSDRIDTKVKIVIAFFLGAILSGTLVQFALPVLAEHASELMIGFTAVIGMLVIIALIFTTFKEFFFKLFFGISKADLEDVKTSANSMAENAVKQDWIAASKDFKVVSQKGSAWYAWLSYRRWVVTVFYTLFLAFAGLLGSVLLYNQNQLLKTQNSLFEIQNTKVEEQTKLFEKQNEQLDVQIHLEESNRRGALIVMMSNIMDRLYEELKDDWNKDEKRNLSPQLIGRIAALSQAFRPYRFLNDSILIQGASSPERGQLLLALASSDLDSITYATIFSKANFRQSYLAGMDLSHLNLSGVNLGASNLSETRLFKTMLRRTDLSGACLSKAILREADLSGAYLMGAHLNEVIVTKTTFKGAWLHGVELREATFNGVDLSDALLIRMDTENNLASFNEVNDDIEGGLSPDLNGAIFQKVNLDNTMVHSRKWMNLLDEWKVRGAAEIRQQFQLNPTLQKTPLHYKIERKN